MKVVAMIGSPHKDGPSTRLALEAVRGARDAGHEVTVYYLNDMNVRGCQGCGTCKNNGIDCILQDDLKPYWGKLHEADALILSAPNYAANVCGPMITYMNRHYCLIDKNWKPRIHPGIQVIALFAQGNGDREMYMDVYRWFVADFENRKMVTKDLIVHVRDDGEVTPEHPLAKRAYQAGATL
ncbi:MAG: flavodoxin family protein [Clostridia bacterium]|nr:flavodoxin family protein [Clostridia bacterium]MBR3195480.1 flavodoxin family protein [Clostridia bacterium]